MHESQKSKVKSQKSKVKSVNLFDANLYNNIYLSFTNFRYPFRKKITIFSNLAINKTKISLYYIKNIVLNTNNELNLGQKFVDIRFENLRQVN